MARHRHERDSCAANRQSSGSETTQANTQIKKAFILIAKTANAENPLINNMKPILGCDVWEHSYYLDYKNKRPAYLENFFEKLINWEFV